MGHEHYSHYRIIPKKRPMGDQTYPMLPGDVSHQSARTRLPSTQSGVNSAEMCQARSVKIKVKRSPEGRIGTSSQSKNDSKISTLRPQKINPKHIFFSKAVFLRSLRGFNVRTRCTHRVCFAQNFMPNCCDNPKLLAFQWRKYARELSKRINHRANFLAENNVEPYMTIVCVMPAAKQS